MTFILIQTENVRSKHILSLLTLTFDLRSLPTIHPSQVKTNPTTKYQVQNSSAGKQQGQMDATKNIITPATQSISNYKRPIIS